MLRLYTIAVLVLGKVQEEAATEERSGENGEIRSLYHGQYDDHDENGEPG